MFILDALNTWKKATTKYSPYTAAFGQKPNNLRNTDFGDSDCIMEESVETLLAEIDTVQKKLPPDHHKNNSSDITPMATMNTDLNQRLHHKNHVSLQNQYQPHLFRSRNQYLSHVQNHHRLTTYGTHQLTSRPPVE